MAAVPILFLATAPLANAAPGDHVSAGTEQVIAPMFKICLLPIGPIPPIICISLGDGEPPTSSNPPPPPPPTSPPPPPPTTPPPTHSTPPPPPPITPTAPASVALRAAVAPPVFTPPTTPTVTPTTTPPSTTSPPTTTQSGRAAVLPTSPGTLRVAPVSQEVVTERRWALTTIVLIFGAGAVATARMRRRVK